MGDLRGGPQLEQPSCQVLPPTLDGYRRYCPYTIHPNAEGNYEGPDLATARRLVAASGTAGQKVTVVGITAVFKPHGGNYLVSVLNSLGYKARFKNFDRSAYFDRRFTAADPSRHRGLVPGQPDTRRLLRCNAHVRLVRSRLERQPELCGVLQPPHRCRDGPRPIAPKH